MWKIYCKKGLIRYVTGYNQVKSATFKHYNITEDAYCTRLRTVTKGKQDSYVEMATRVMDLTQKWTRWCAADTDRCCVGGNRCGAAPQLHACGGASVGG